MAVKQETYQKMLQAACLAVLAGILAAGLWPFHAPANQVEWLPTQSGLHFGDYGSILTAGTMQLRPPTDETPMSLEIRLEPGLLDDSNTILAFYSKEFRISFALHQYLSDLGIELNRPGSHDQEVPVTGLVPDVFTNKPVLITLTAGSQGMAVYSDGVLAKTFKTLSATSRDLSGKLIVANSPLANDSWSGRLFGLAVYNQRLTPQQVAEHYRTWATEGRPNGTENQGGVALYLFNERSGNVVHNQAGTAPDLMIPDRFFVLHSAFLAPPWEEFFPSWDYWRNVAINIAGFIPLGFFFYAYFLTRWPSQRAMWTVMAIGILVSLTIEIGQAFLPTRESGMTDLITNTLGTVIGAVLCRVNAVRAIVSKSVSVSRQNSDNTSMALSAPSFEGIISPVEEERASNL